MDRLRNDQAPWTAARAGGYSAIGIHVDAGVTLPKEGRSPANDHRVSAGDVSSKGYRIAVESGRLDIADAISVAKRFAGEQTHHSRGGVASVQPVVV
jgi:hypothetical protein